LLAVTTIVLVWFPIVSKNYDYRFVIPTFGPLFATAALSAWGLALRIRSRGARWRRSRLPASSMEPQQ
jgi:hypothetical protein